MMPHILLTNDDGYQAEGLRALAAALEGFATVNIVAPSREQSGTPQSLTLRQPIECNKIAEREWAIAGTPAECLSVALNKILPDKQSTVISGVSRRKSIRTWSQTRITQRSFQAPFPSRHWTSMRRTRNRSIIFRTGPRPSPPRFIARTTREIALRESPARNRSLD